MAFRAPIGGRSRFVRFRGGWDIPDLETIGQFRHRGRGLQAGIIGIKHLPKACVGRLFSPAVGVFQQGFGFLGGQTAIFRFFQKDAKGPFFFEIEFLPFV